jgi:hypothetical protein
VRTTHLLGVMFLGALAFGATQARADGMGQAAKLSAALGGILDTELGEAGALTDGTAFSSAVLWPGRGAEYRRRVALETQRAAQSGTSGAHVANNGRSPAVIDRR